MRTATVQDPLARVIAYLQACRDDAKAAGADPEGIGCREVELARKFGRATWAVLKALRREGLITRSGGWAWLNNDARNGDSDGR